VIKPPSTGLSYWSRRIDWPLMAAVLVLLAIGVITVTSAVSPMGNPTRFIVKQIIAIGIGSIFLFLASSINYQLFRSHPGIVYGVTVFLLTIVLIVGKRINGAKAWIVMGPVSFEPLELARIGFILVLAALLDRPEREITSSFKVIAAAFALAFGHMFLILLEPYIGGTLVYIPILLGMLYFAGVRPIYLLAMIFYGVVAIGIPMLSTYFSVQPQLLENHHILNFFVSSAKSGRSAAELLFVATALIFFLWWFVRKLQVRIPWQYPALLSLIVAMGVYTAFITESIIKDYQRKRLMVFLIPGFDPLGAGYQLLQSQIAIGSGRVFGKGLFSGSQTQLGFLPEKHTDFIFSVVGEELGFIWASVILAAFAVIVWRAFFIAAETQDRFGTLIAVGIGCLFAFTCVMNIGMVLGILPVTGVALPFVSYGGSHIVCSMLAIGVLQSVNFRRYMY
jgi:rod shape determining protein RodA